MTKLSVNINKIATLRNSRGGNEPNVVDFAIDIQSFGADGAINAALLAASIIGNNNSKVKDKLKSWRLSQTKSVKKNPK